jgi:hypothetical protein
MMRATIGTLGHLTLVGLTVACSGRVQDLGHDSFGGSGPTVGGAPTTGGAATTGGTVATGGSTGWVTPPQGGTTQRSLVPYVVDPTLPIDPTCICDSPDQICNAEKACVARCDDGGRCTRWLANQPVVDMTVDGTTLYFAEKATTDAVGNPGTNGALYKVNPTDREPTLVGGHLGAPYKILGRYQGATYVQTQTSSGGTIVKVSDSGDFEVLETIGWGASMWGHWLAYTTADNAKLMGIDLDVAQEPAVLAQPPAETSSSSPVSQLLVMRDLVLFQEYGHNEICSVQLANPTSGASCGAFSWGGMDRYATSGIEYYKSDRYMVTSYSPLNTQLLFLYNVNAEGLGLLTGKIVYNDGWLYVDFIADRQESSRLARIPTTVGRLPQDVLPEPIVARHNSFAVGDGRDTTTDMVFAIGPSDVYWVQYLSPTNANGPQYIFSGPLPPKPCDADLPCSGSLVCVNGYCGAP